MRALVPVAVACIAGCSLSPVPTEGLACPCAEPAQCDEARGVCIDPTGSPCNRTAPPGAVSVSGFELEWAAPNQVRLRWDVPDEYTEITEFQVDVADSDDALAAAEGLRTIEASENPELGGAFLLRTRGADPVSRTIVRGLDAGMRYSMRLVVYDTAGGVTCTPIVSVRTMPSPTDSLDLFADAAPPGASPRPSCAQIVDDATLSHSGSSHLAYTYLCEDARPVCTEPASPDGTCFENVGIQGTDGRLSLLEGRFTTSAYLEAAVAIDDDVDAYWSEPGILVGGCAWIRGRVTIPADGAYHLVQIPLPELTMQAFGPSCPGGVQLDLETLNENPITEARVGATLSHGATMRVDSLAIRW